jgi:LmbE family N-acetylglucosaminyl deacetylase
MTKNRKTRGLTRGNSKTKAMIVVAHPDDETLFMIGPILKQRAHRSHLKSGEIACKDWTIVCVTDANGNGEGTQRLKLFQRACRSLGAKAVCLGHPDIFDQPIDTNRLRAELAAMGAGWSAIYTHGPLGEYGHRHHQGVSLAVHELFYKVYPIWSVTSNVAAELTIPFTPAEFKKKTQILMRYYHGEIRKFLNLIPIHSNETYHSLSLKQVQTIQDAVSGKTVSPQALGPYAWLYPILKEGDWATVAEKFFKIYF